MLWIGEHDKVGLLGSESGDQERLTLRTVRVVRALTSSDRALTSPDHERSSSRDIMSVQNQHEAAPPAPVSARFAGVQAERHGTGLHSRPQARAQHLITRLIRNIGERAAGVIVTSRHREPVASLHIMVDLRGCHCTWCLRRSRRRLRPTGCPGHPGPLRSRQALRPPYCPLYPQHWK